MIQEDKHAFIYLTGLPPYDKPLHPPPLLNVLTGRAGLIRLQSPIHVEAAGKFPPTMDGSSITNCMKWSSKLQTKKLQLILNIEASIVPFF